MLFIEQPDSISCSICRYLLAPIEALKMFVIGFKSEFKSKTHRYTQRPSLAYRWDPCDSVSSIFQLCVGMLCWVSARVGSSGQLVSAGDPSLCISQSYSRLESCCCYCCCCCLFYFILDSSCSTLRVYRFLSEM